MQEKKFAIVNEETLVLNWRQQQFAISGSAKGSIVHAVFTTSLARIKLYRELLKPLGTRIFYCDTDSAVYLSEEGLYNPPNGDFLGDLTDELDPSGEVVIGECGSAEAQNITDIKATTCAKTGPMSTSPKQNSSARV